MAPEVLLGGVIASLAGLIVALVWGVKSLVTTISAQNTNLQGSNQQVITLVAQIAVLTRKLAELDYASLVNDEKIKALSQSLREKDGIIARLQTENMALSKLVDTLQARVERLETTLEDRETEIKTIKQSGPTVAQQRLKTSELDALSGRAEKALSSKRGQQAIGKPTTEDLLEAAANIRVKQTDELPAVDQESDQNSDD